LELRVNPHAKKPQQAQIHSDKKYCLSTQKYTVPLKKILNSVIKENTLVELLTQLIHNTCNQIKASWLQSQHFISYGKLLVADRDAENGKTLRNITLPSPFTSIDQHD
jgi:hypothetical protein